MAKGVRFGTAFLQQRKQKCDDWKKRGVRAGHGGQFSTGFAELPDWASATSEMKQANFTTGACAVGSGFKELPEWLKDEISSDKEIQRALVDKQFKPDSPHRQALVRLAKDPSLYFGRSATPTQGRKNADREHFIQVCLFHRLSIEFPDEYFFVKAVPNGGQRNHSTAFKLQAEGVKPGAPDIDVEIPKSCFHGMKLEVKTESGTLSEAQSERMEKLGALGYYVYEGRGFYDCWNAISNYLRLPDFDKLLGFTGTKLDSNA
ncbi:hypothetical protein L4174_023665 (plasmid) [Photobacterium sp. CCB-ST2H9]|uniref:hypothetical protein n=1 Tax=Photobacterium sp. CCB-ST2H9 TaxID=2912855 RepID=UPI0020047729|nr:hypothetical protein [Photobacterium sp. CCB-ST2H9]UTM60467.1 hypothetical protein L4174_023665 [Photobacterium sp. CCB-ST2H9]